MFVAVVGGTGLVGTETVRAALARGHRVRSVTRHSGEQTDAPAPVDNVEHVAADVTDPATLPAALADIDVVIHVVGIGRETPPDLTFDRINVEGTRHLLAAARAASVRRIVFISSLGAERGSSDYHRSKRQAEQLVREYGGEWVILRPGNVYGANGGMIGLFMRLVRIAPVVPAAGDADAEFQPIWAADLAQAIVQSCERNDVVGRSIELAGLERTSQKDLYDRMTRIANRHPPLIPIPTPFSELGAHLLDAVGIESPITADQLVMIDDGNVLLDEKNNALRDLFGVQPMPLEKGLRELARSTSEQLPGSGSGAVVRRRFWIDIAQSQLTPEQVITLVRREFAELMPALMVDVGPEPISDKELTIGATISLGLPLRGHVQIRVEEITPHSITNVTLEGHPLAGVVRFLGEQRGELVRFEVQTIDHPQNALDRAVMAMLGTHLKRATWISLLNKVLERSGGSAEDGVQNDEETLDAEQTRHVTEWVRTLIARRQRAAAPTPMQP